MRYILLVGVVGIGAMVVGILAARLVRKRLRSPSSTQAFAIQDLRDMRRRGEITDDEYRIMRDATIAQVNTPPTPEQFESEPAGQNESPPPPGEPSDPPAGEDP